MSLSIPKNKTAIRTIVVDDELLARKNLILFLQEFCEGIDIIGDADSLQSAYDLIIKEQPDLVFLDIRMPSRAEGFDLLQKFENPTFKLVFVTAFKDYAIQAFKANAIDYILKPVEIEELQKVVEKIKNLAPSTETNVEASQNLSQRLENTFEAIKDKKITRIAISHSKGIKLVELAAINYLQADGNYTCIHFADKTKFFDTRTLKVYQELLPANHFLRVHNSYIINADYIHEYNNENGPVVVFKNGDKVPISRANLPSFIEFCKGL